MTATHIRRSIARVASRAHDSGGLRLHRRDAADPERQDGPFAPARAVARATAAREQVHPAVDAHGEGAARIWSEVLAIDDIGIHDDFFELGGDSLGAARVVGRVQRTFDVELPFTAIYEAPTAAELAKAIHESLPATSPATHQGLVTRVESRAVSNG